MSFRCPMEQIVLSYTQPMMLYIISQRNQVSIVFKTFPPHSSFRFSFILQLFIVLVQCVRALVADDFYTQPCYANVQNSVEQQ